MEQQEKRDNENGKEKVMEQKVENNGKALSAEKSAEESAWVPPDHEEIDRRQLTRREAIQLLKRELLTRLDEYAFECAIDFKDLSGSGREELEVENFIHKLDPAIDYLLDKLDGVLPLGYPDASMGRPGDDLVELHATVAELAYIVGVIAGAKFAGASRDKLEFLCEHAVQNGPWKAPRL